MKYLVFGETIWDVYPDRNVIGGAPFNFSANVALMGGDVYFVTGLGNDELGAEAVEMIKKYGIKTDFISYNDKQTGRCIVTLDSSGIPRYNVLTDTAYDNITLGDGVIERIREISPEVFYFNTLAQRCEVSRDTICRILGAVEFEHIFCDVNIRPGCWDKESLKLCMERADIVKISEEEAHYLKDCGLVGVGDFEQAVHAAFPNLRILIYTMGAKGSVVYDFENNVREFSGEPEAVEVVSTVGAGDCYSASFVHAYLSGCCIREAIQVATRRSNIVVSHTEAIPAELAEENG